MGSETATITTTVEDALTSPNQEYTLEYEVTETLNNGLYLYVSYQNQLSHAPDPDIEIGDLPGYAEYSFGDLYGGVSFYEPEGFLFEDSTGNKLENYNLFFSQTVTMPTLVSEWTQASGEETEYQPANMTGVVGFDLIDINAAVAEGDFFSLDKTIAYLEACRGEALINDQRQRFRITATLRHSNTENVPLTSSIEIFNYANAVVETYNFTTDLNSGTGFPINNLASSDSTNPKTTIISFNAFNAKPGSTSSTILTHLPTTFYAYYYNDPEATTYDETNRNNNVVNAIGYVSNASISLVNDNTKPTLTISAPAGEYKSGDLVPITITADEYIHVDDNATVTINNEPYDLLDDLHSSSDGKFISFLYEVKEIDSGTLTVQSVTGITDFFDNNAEEVDGEPIDGITLDTPLLKNAVEDFTADYDEGNDEITFEITAKQHEEYQTLYGDFSSQGNYTDLMRLIINGDTTNPRLVTMAEGANDTFTFMAAPYTVERTEEQQIITVQLQVNDGSQWVTVNRVTQTVTIAAQVDVESVAISVVGDVSQGEDGTYTIALDDETFPQLQAEFTPDNTTSKTGTWSSLDPDIATITPDEDDPTLAQITPTSEKVGPVTFTFTADNGTTGENETDDNRSDTITFTVVPGDKLTLSIPQYAQDSMIRDGDPFTVQWVTNALVFYPGQEHTFTVTITKDGDAEPTYEGTTSGTELTVDGGTLTATYPQSEYTVKVTLDNPVEGQDDLTASASLTVLSPPTQMRITTDETSIRDDETLTLDYSITNNSAATGTVSVTRMVGGTTAEDTGSWLNTSSVSGEGQVIFTPSPVEDNDLYDTYTITFTENTVSGSDDFTPSADSIVIYVYKSDALSILVDGQPPEENGITLSNEAVVNDPEKPPKDSKTIMELRQELGLIEYVSINADDYNWSSFSDGIEWTAENAGDADVAVNYKQGGLWDDVLDLSYTTYLPRTQMAVSATIDGTATVTATHAATGMSDRVTVSVDTLRDQLYLFQVTPAQTTTLTYTDGAGKEKTVTTNEDGLLALYEPEGIHSDVRLRSGDDKSPLLGTILQGTLVSGERDAAKLQLYPLNTITLVPAAQAELYLVEPDGTPYEDSVTIRGGVYLEGHYCGDGVTISTGVNSTPVPGSQGASFTTDGDGKLTVYLDATQFEAEGYNGPLTNAALDYWFELRFDDTSDYFPMLVNIQGAMSADRILRTGSAVVLLEEVPAGQENTPFLTAQTVTYGKTAADEAPQVRNVLGSTGKVGPNSTFQYAELTSHFMLWGVETRDGEATVSMTGDTGAALPQQTVTDETFPFASIPVVTNTTVLTEATMTDSGWLGGKQAANLRASVYQNGELMRNVPMSFQAADLTRVDLVDTDAAALLVEMKGSVSTKGADFSFRNNQVSNAFSRDITGMINELQDVGSPMFKVLITPTEDNTVFNALIWGGYNSLDISDFDYSEEGVSTDYSLLDTEWGVGVPPVNDLSSMAKGTYDPMDDIQTAMIGGSNSGLDIGAQLEGYYEGQFYYDTDRQEWVFRATGGGMTAGGSLSFQANLNAWVGPIPVTATFAAGIALQLDFQAATVYTGQQDEDTLATWTAEARGRESVNDYLTTLRLNGYINAFGGFGFDYSILALKIGLYGELGGDSTNTFLSREYLQQDKQLNGQALGVIGEVGIKFYAKFLFISYETVIGSGSFQWSQTFNRYRDIADYWGIHEDDDDTDGASFRMGPATLLSRSYLAAYAKNSAARWDGSPTFDDEATAVQEDANPGSEPAVNDDGSLSVYISDKGSESFYDSRIFAGEVGTMGTAIHDGDDTDNAGKYGYGDMSPSLAGTEAFSVAAWVRLTEKLTTKDSPTGDESDKYDALSPDEQKQLLNSTEIMVATTSGTGWDTEALTVNTSPDLAPVAVVGGDNAAVFWRSVYASDPGDEGEGLLNFDTQDAIYVSFYNGNSWDDARMVYNGSTGTVAGIQAAMLPDGTALVAFILDRGSDNPDDEPYQGYELAYRTVKSNGDLGELVVLTNDTEIDTNPQVAAVSKDEEDYFLLAWYSTQGGGDIRLQAVDADGQPHTGGALAVPASVNAMTQGSGLVISADFRLAKRPAGSDVEGLTLVWPQVVNDPDTGAADHSVLYGVRLCGIGGETRLSAPQALITLPNRTLANSFSTWQEIGGQVNAYIFGTWYDPEETEMIPGYKEPVAKDTDQLLTGGGTITEKAVEVEAIAVDYENLQISSYTPVVFTLRNTGASQLTRLTVTVDGYTATLASELDPGESAPVTVMYKTGDPIENPTYTVTDSDNNELSDGTLYLDYNDLGISAMRVVREEEGERDVLVTLYNSAAAKLADASGRTVELTFYTDSKRATPATVTLSGNQSGVSLSRDGTTVTLDGDALKRIDQGSLALLVTFDLKDYVESDLDKEEVPESGVYLYADVRVKDDKDKVMAEYATGDNQAAVQLTGLYARTGQRATLDVVQGESADGATSTAKVTLTNNSLKDLNSGTLVASLLDGNGNVLDTQTLTAAISNVSGEDTAAQDITFGAKGSRVVVYAAVAGEDTLVFDGLPVTIGDFAQAVDETGTPIDGQYVYELPGTTAIDHTVVTAIPGDGADSVIINGGQPLTGGGSDTVSIRGTTDIVVTIGDKIYTLTVHGAGSSGGGGGGGGSSVTRYPVNLPGSVDNGAVTASPTRASRGQRVTLTVTPDEGYVLGSLTVTDRNGNAVAFTDAGNGKYTFSMPSSPVNVAVSFRPESDTDLPFLDVAQDSWYYDAVSYVYRHGLMAGTSDTIFAPNANLTRAMMATVLWAMEGSPVVNYAMTYTDVSGDAWYTEAVRWATSEGVVSGVGDGRFSPDSPITREQMAVMLYAYAVHKGYDTSHDGAAARSFHDYDAISDWARTAMERVVDAGMIGGKPGNILDPGGTATRAEVATILMRFCQLDR